MTTLLPRDADDNIIPALRLKDGSAHSIVVTATTARNSMGFSADTKVIGLYATTDVYLNFGGSGVEATTSDHFFPVGIYYDIAISGGGGKSPKDTHVAALRVSGDGTLYISEKE